jgi:DNA-binding MarR family transcriptional regulator
MKDHAEGSAPITGLAEGLTAGFIGPKVRMLWNLLNARMVAALSPFGLRAGAFSAMALISANPGCSQNELARGLGMDKSAVVAVLDQLQARGLVNRSRPAGDRRRHALELTSEGEALMHRMRSAVAVPGRPIREALSPEELRQLLSLLDRACRALAEAPWDDVNSTGEPSPTP